ncbi:TPR repeat (TPR) (PDB:1KLX) [Commensalibacter communis]|uniref:tetratricopeptide repeat protein n=1 Tax=Commensalibacter communis TaxID=2972786 RepID=UPI0022FFA867|nr:tetratricopeptide repeat protein [Commensalibacter communis]CAI3956104.1 TPR repeat (TPR) (PDB:1KLX) [Commensalibacter communis]
MFIAVGLTCFTSHAFAEQELSLEKLELIKQDANKGVAEAQELLAELYENGDNGIEKDPFAAKEWYEKAAQQGNTDAMIGLSNMYQKGNGVPQDYAKSKEILEKAAEQNVAAAQYNLGILYSKGLGVPRNYTKAIEWYQKAATQEYGAAYNNIGVMYYAGAGVPVNMTKAKEYYKQACLHKNIKGCKNYKKLNN